MLTDRSRENVTEFNREYGYPRAGAFRENGANVYGPDATIQPMRSRGWPATASDVRAASLKRVRAELDVFALIRSDI